MSVKIRQNHNLQRLDVTTFGGTILKWKTFQINHKNTNVIIYVIIFMQAILH